MLEIYFQEIVLTSLLGAIFALILVAVKPITQKHFSASWHYYIWLLVLVVMVVPVRLNLSKLKDIPTVSMVAERIAVALDGILDDAGLTRDELTPKEIMRDEEGHMLVSSHLQQRREVERVIGKRMDLIVTIWGTVALSILAFKLGCYIVFLWKVGKTTKEIPCPELVTFTRRRVIVRTGEWVSSPLLLGIFRPVLLLPHREMNGEQLHNVLAHEMTHLRRNDMFYKWFVVVVKCIHWFNPIVYMVGKQVNQDCEISCDLSVTEYMNKAERMSYVETILALFAERRHKDYTLTMGMAGSKELLKKRFLRMKNRIIVSEKVRKRSGIVAAILLIVAVLVSSILAEKAFPDLKGQNIMPAISECEECGLDALFYSRVMGTKSVDTTVELYYIYLFKCERCHNEWRELQEITVQYTVKMDMLSIIIPVEEMLINSDVEIIE